MPTDILSKKLSIIRINTKVLITKQFISFCLLSLFSFTVLASSIEGSSTLDEILKGKILLVGTTGDYPPFSKLDAEEFFGIDIDMAKDFAVSTGVKVRFVKTTWGTLISDLNNKKFHIALSGISINQNRKADAAFSSPYVHYGKLPIVRCEQAHYFDSWSKIDNIKTRVIVNPGGTNEKYVNEHIYHAQVTVFPDNRTIFSEIIAGRADVMISDSIEVYYQSKLSRGRLCPASIEKLTEGTIGILMPKDTALQHFVDTWLANFESTGKKKLLFQKYLAQ